MIALSLGRRKPFLTVLSCDCRVSLATGADKLQVQSRPLCPESDRPPSQGRMSRWANNGLMHCNMIGETPYLSFRASLDVTAHGCLSARHFLDVRRPS
jgi:hypothetical protein